jgi:hypothetical protein
MKYTELELFEIKKRFETKYPNGWMVQGNNEPRWVDFNDGTTDVGGTYYKYNYYTDFSLNYYGDRIWFAYQKYDNKTLISVDEFFSLLNNEKIENNYEIY